jgi:hypothetical protein
VDSELVQRLPSVKTAEIGKYDLRDVFTGVYAVLHKASGSVLSSEQLPTVCIRNVLKLEILCTKNHFQTLKRGI